SSHLSPDRWRARGGRLQSAPRRPLHLFGDAAAARLETDSTALNQSLRSSFCLSMIFVQKPVPTFRDHALIDLDQLPPARRCMVAQLVDRDTSLANDARRRRGCPRQIARTFAGSR